MEQVRRIFLRVLVSGVSDGGGEQDGNDAGFQEQHWGSVVVDGSEAGLESMREWIRA
jgi:hypothetical protein